MVVAAVTREATIPVLPFLVVTAVGNRDTQEAAHSVVNVVDIFIREDDSKVSSVSKKEIANDVKTVPVAIDFTTLVIYTTVLAKDACVTIVVKIVEL